MNRYTRALHLVFGHAWAIQSETLEMLAEVVMRRAAGDVVTEVPQPAVDAALSSFGDRVGRQDVGRVAVLPVRDVIVPRHNIFTWLFGGTSLEDLQGAIDEAVADPEISAILLDVDSPGGSVDGLAEFAAHVRSVRDRGTYIAAHADYLMASAAYYIASSAHEIVAAPSSLVGSIGTVAVHRDFSRAEDAAGITNTIIASDPRKVQTHSLKPLSEEGQAEIQSIVDHFAAAFVNDVAKGRGIPASKVLDEFGGGSVLLADAALKVGMVDRVEPINATANRLDRGGKRLAATRAADEPIELAALVEAMTTDDEPSPEPQTDAAAPDADELPPHVREGIAAITRTREDRLAAAAQLRSH